MTIHQRATYLFAFAICLLSTDSIRAVDLTWTGTGGLLFFDTATNWDPVQTPTGADDLFFDIDTGSTPIIVGASSLFSDMAFSDFDWELTGAASGTLTSTNGSVRIDDPTGLDLAGGVNVALTEGLSLDASGDFYVGQAGFGGLTLSSVSPTAPTTARVRDVFIGQNAGSTGLVTVTGQGTQLITDGTGGANGYYIGNAGTGTLNVTSGGLARILNDTSGGIADLELGVQATGVGTLNINGPGSQFIAEDSVFGNAGAATVNITGGGQLLQNIGGSPDAFVAAQAGSTGDVTVSGDGSQWQARRIEIGNLGAATLSVEAGGLVRSTAGNMLLGDVAGGTGRVAVFGDSGGGTPTPSTLEVVADTLFVGGAGTGDLSVGVDLDGNELGGGLVEAPLIVVGDLNAATSNLVVAGPGSELRSLGNLTIGEEGKGNFEARNGAQVNVTASLILGEFDDGDGTATISGAGTKLTADRIFAANDTAASTPGVALITVAAGGEIDITGIGSNADSTGNDAIVLGDSGGATAELRIQGAGSRVRTTNAGGGWFIGGSEGESGGVGTVNIDTGGAGVSGDRVVVGYGASSQGTLNIDGAGSTFDVDGDFILVGFLGSGEVNVTDGGVLNANGVGGAFIADGSSSGGSSVTVSGAGSEFNLTNRLHVGDSARGTLTVENGGVVRVATNATGVLNNRLTVGSGAAADGSLLTITGAGSLVDYFGDERISVGLSGGSASNRARLEVLNGGRLNAVQRDGMNAVVSSGFLMVADEAGSNGLVTVDGTGSRIDVRYMQVGDGPSGGANGIVDITGGGLITTLEHVEAGSNGSGNGTINVSGSGSRLEVGGYLSLGDDLPTSGAATGTMNISDGGVVTTAGFGYIGRYTGSFGTATVGGSGQQASWQLDSDLFIAGTEVLSVSGSQSGSGSGTLNVETNGTVSVAGMLVLKDRGVINLNGGEVAASNFLFQDFAERSLSPTVNFNSGTLRYTAGKTLTDNDLATIFGSDTPILSPGQHLAIDGIVVLAGASDPNSVLLRLNGGELSVGSISTVGFRGIDFDAGTLNLTNTGLVVTAAGLLGSVAVVDGDQTINVASTVFVQGDGLLNVAGGTLTMGAGVVNTGGTLVVAAGEVDFGGGLNNNGDVVLIDAVTDGTLTNNGDLTIINTVVGGSLAASSSGTISLDIGVVGDADLLDLSGTASLAGTLDVSLDGVTGLTAGDEFDLLLADAGITGTFDTELLPMVGSGLALDVLYEANRVALVVTLAGDYNGDGTVDLSDYTIWRNNLGATGLTAYAPGDGNGDGEITIADYELWKGQYGQTVASMTADSSNVPEPSTAAIVLGLGLLVALRRVAW